MSNPTALDDQAQFSKLLLALTNLVALLPIAYACHWSDKAVLAVAMLCSTAHHCVEQRYYGPPLIQASQRQQWWLLQADRTSALLAILWLGTWRQLREEWGMIAVALLLMLASEAVMFLGLQPKTAIELRTTLHGTWHFAALCFLALSAVGKYAHEERLVTTAVWLPLILYRAALIGMKLALTLLIRLFQ